MQVADNAPERVGLQPGGYGKWPTMVRITHENIAKISSLLILFYRKCLSLQAELYKIA